MQLSQVPSLAYSEDQGASSGAPTRQATGNIMHFSKLTTRPRLSQLHTRLDPRPAQSPTLGKMTFLIESSFDFHKSISRI
jgi:hypothetical protein